MKTFALILFLLAVSVLLSGCGGEDTTPISVKVDEEISVPYGYTLIDVSAYGRFSGDYTYYCQNDVTKVIVECTDNKIGREIRFPEGYSFIGAAEYGEFSGYKQFYCRQDATGRVFICKIE